MADKKKVVVEINHQEYSVYGRDSEEYIKSIARYVDEELQGILSKNKKFTGSMAAVLTAFTIADKYHKLKAKDDENSIKMKEFGYIKDNFDRINDKYEEAVELRDKCKLELGELKRKEMRFREKSEQYEDALKLKEQELENSQKIINQLQNKLFEEQIELVQTKKELEELKKALDKK